MVSGERTITIYTHSDQFRSSVGSADEKYKLRRVLCLIRHGQKRVLSETSFFQALALKITFSPPTTKDTKSYTKNPEKLTLVTKKDSKYDSNTAMCALEHYSVPADSSDLCSTTKPLIGKDSIVSENVHWG